MLRFLLRLPLFRRLAWQAALIFTLLLAAALTVFGGLAYTLAADSLEKELGRRLANAAALVAHQFKDEPVGPAAPAGKAARRLTAEIKILARTAALDRLLLLDDQGRVLLDSREDALIGSPYVYLALDQGEWQQALQGGNPSTTLFPGSDGRFYKSAFAPLEGKSGPRAVLRAEASADFLEDLQRLGRSLLGLGLFSLGLGLALALVASRPLVRPLQALIRASRQIAKGDFAARIDIDRPDELGQLALTFNEMAAELGALIKQQERLAALGEVAAGMAHEIRNPLAAIAAFAGLLERRLKPRDPGLAHAQDIQREVRIVNGFLEDFLEYARPRPPKFEACDLVKVAAGSMRVAFPVAAQRRFKLKLTGLKALPAQSDPLQLRQVLLNLLTNAREASGRGGSISLDVQRQGREAWLSVVDQGKGVPAAQRQDLFKPFFTSKPMGTGLGLSIAQKIVEGLGGRIEVESVEQKGSRFSVVLPLKGQE